MAKDVGTTPLTETLDAWAKRYALSPPERELLFSAANGLSFADHAFLCEETEEAIATRAEALADRLYRQMVELEEGPHPGFQALVNRLLRRALALATHDQDVRRAKREDGDDGT